MLLAAALTLGLHAPLWASTSPRSRLLRLNAAGDPVELRESAASEREVALGQREQAVRQREQAVELRERAVDRREEALRQELRRLDKGRKILIEASLPLKLGSPKKPKRRVATLAEFEQAVAEGVGYKSMDIRGDSGALAPRPDVPAPAAAHPVVAALHRRTAQGSQPGKRRDGLKIALAIEGGGMRGCVAAGMAAAVSELGLLSSFDAVYGASAGSLIGAYLLSGQDYRFGCSVYYDDLCRAGPAFIDLRNSLRSLGLGALRVTPTGLKEMFSSRLGTPVLNLDFLLEEVIQRQKPIDWDGFSARQAAQPLRVVASGLHSEKAVVLGAEEGHWSDLAGLAQCMRASMLLPGICGPPITLPSMEGGAEPLADAMLFEPIPYRAALAEGATHVLVLRTRPDGVNLVRKQAIIEKLISHRFFRRKLGLRRMAKHMEQQRHRVLYAEDILRLNQGASATTVGEAAAAAAAAAAAGATPGAPPSPQLLAVALQEGPRGPEVSNLQTDSAELFYAVRCGFARGFELLRPPELASRDAWDAACEAFPDATLEEVLAKQGKEWAKPEPGEVGAGRSRATAPERKEKSAPAEPTADPAE